MTANTEVLRRASLEGLRAEAQDELGSVVTERLHSGEDPWAFMDELPTIDELVVLLLRADLFDAEGGESPAPTTPAIGGCSATSGPRIRA